MLFGRGRGTTPNSINRLFWLPHPPGRRQGVRGSAARSCGAPRVESPRRGGLGGGGLTVTSGGNGGAVPARLSPSPGNPCRNAVPRSGMTPPIHPPIQEERSAAFPARRSLSGRRGCRRLSPRSRRWQQRREARLGTVGWLCGAGRGFPVSVGDEGVGE